MLEMIKTGTSKTPKKEGDNVVLFSVSISKDGLIHADISKSLKKDKKLTEEIIEMLRDIQTRV